MARVILDAMGGDHAPQANLDGVAFALQRGFVAADEIALVGDAASLTEALREHSLGHIEVIDAPDPLQSDESPVEALRRRPRNSIAVGVGLVQSGQADAFVSAGNTGLVVATASIGLGLLPGIRRPGIAIVIDSDAGPCMVIDVGANAHPKPQHLLQYGIMGSAYFKDTFGEARPRVALMNIGSEDKKGTPLIREAKALLQASKLNFIGNIEGVGLFKGECDVVVCDGFTGNVLLKASEGVAEHILHNTARLMAESGIDRETTMTVLSKLQAKVDYSSYGGALLLGTNGIVTICHGRSKGPAIGNAIRFARKAVGARVNDHIVEMVRDVLHSDGASTES